MKRFQFLFFLLLLFSGCSTKNKGFINRAYHNTTARYNGFFNAKESIKEGVSTFEETREEDYDAILPIFIMPSESEASALLPSMNRAIEKSEKVITRHSMEIGGKEYCRWIDDNYLTKGIGHLYKREYKDAISTFGFIAKRYPEESSKSYALSWLIITHLENDNPAEANLVLPALNKLQELKRKPSLMRQKVNAAYHIAKGNYAEAIEHINQAIGLEKKRKNRVRLYFIKAQLYQQLDNSNEAIVAYRYVAKKSADYNLAFKAGISQATAVKGSANSFAVKKDLEKLLKDDKNIEFHDQIYYALAEIAFTEREYDEAVDLLNKSIESSIDNNRQKGKSFYKLAKYYFGEKLYQPASINYDSTLSILPNSHPEYAEIKSKSNNLRELVVHLNKIDLNDSLLYLANLDPEELDKKLGDIISAERERLLREQREKELKANLAKKSSSKNKGNNGGWYFHNSKSKEQGFTVFKDKWGNRPLEDNWRRKSKGLSSSFANNNSGNSANPNNAGGEELAGLPSLKTLRGPIPQTTDQKQKLIQETKYALYQSGLVYKENFKDIDNSIESFENLLSRYDTTLYRLPSYYQLYRLYLIKENQSEKEFFSFDTKSSSFYYKDLILYEYPGSEFAQLIKNPEAVKDKSKSNKEAERQYQKAYLAYSIDSISRSFALVEEGITKFGDNAITPKFYFLKGRLYAALKDINEFEKTLEFISKTYPTTEEGKEAKKLLALLRKSLAAANKSTNTSTKPDSKETATADEEVFKQEPTLAHFYIVIIPEGSMNTNRAKIEVSNFNSRFFANNKMNVSQTFLSNEEPILIVKGLKDIEMAKQYHNAFIADKNELRVIARKKLTSFAISEGNFKTLFVKKNTEAYLKFFEKNY